MSAKVLFIGIHRPMRSPSQRFRFEQYIAHLNANGFDCKQAFLLNAKDDKVFYAKGNYLGKLWILLKSIYILTVEAFFKRYDVVYVQREAFMLGSVFFERQFAKRSKLIFDFDDAIWIPAVSANNQSLSFLKDFGKTAKIISFSDMVFAGNEYLADYARQYNQNVKIVPTTLDTDYHRPSNVPKEKICIGWCGSFSTIPHFQYAEPILEAIYQKYGDKVYFKVIGDANYKNEKLNIQGVAWSLKEEVSGLSEFDIGIMPLPEDKWTKGKCGFKGLSFMSMAIPTIMSAVGVNKDIIQDGENGFLASSTEEWIEKLSLLVEKADLRKKIGAKGRETVLNQYSVLANQELYLRCFNEVSA